MRSAAFCVFLLALAGCTARKTVQLPRYGVSPDQTYIDVEPGSRLRVVTPLLKSGGYRVRQTESRTTGLNVELRVDSDFQGYELAHYTLEPRARVRLTSVEATIDGTTQPRTQPKARLFDWPKDARHVRLVFLTRASKADHDMAVLTARRFEDLDVWTARLRADPESACEATKYCSWIPAGIAVTAERRDPASQTWRPADRR